MTLIEPRCCICEKPLAGTDWVCTDCAAQWALDRPFSEWPRWAKLLKKHEQRERDEIRKQRRYGIEVIPASSSPAIEELFYGAGDVEYSERSACDHTSDGCAYENIYAEPLLQYKPYKTRAENALYHAVSDVHRKRYGPCIPIGPVCTGEWTLAASRGHR